MLGPNAAVNGQSVGGGWGGGAAQNGLSVHR